MFEIILPARRRIAAVGVAALLAGVPLRVWAQAPAVGGPSSVTVSDANTRQVGGNNVLLFESADGVLDDPDVQVMDMNLTDTDGTPSLASIGIGMAVLVNP
jgi:hypothetical protein